jgi:hypothetical protein
VWTYKEFNSDVYGSEVISNEMRYHVFDYASISQHESVLLSKKHVTLHDQKVYSFWKNDVQEQFTHSESPFRKMTSSPELLRMSFQTTRASTFYERSNYTVLEFLGDVTALFEALYFISQALMYLL